MLHGKNLIDGRWTGSNETVASADLDGFSVAQATTDQINAACTAARAAFRPFSRTSRTERAAFLKAIADEIDALGDEISKTGVRETGLPEARLAGERGRTTAQLRMFAELISNDDYLDIRIEKEQPDRQPLPRPDLRLTHRAIGPVAVFGASNFPLAFSTAGGDTASALAAGCPVIVKGHGAHAGVAELVAQSIASAVKSCGLPAASFQFLQGAAPRVGVELVQNPDISAVGFTGSLKAGRALYDLCHSRPQPIPFYGELGSVNPVFCLPDAMAARAAEIGAGWAASLTMGAGQFCTNPGVLVAVKNAAFSALQSAAADALIATAEQTMLTEAIGSAYHQGVADFAGWMEAVTGTATIPDSGDARRARPAAFRVDAATWMANPVLQHEVFGAVGICVECDDTAQMLEVANALEGQLTVTLQLDEGDRDLAAQMVPVLEEKAGRLLCNGFPTGVEVSAAMMHGGPYPASTDIRATSVGTLAIMRWLRPVAYQNFPPFLLPVELAG